MLKLLLQKFLLIALIITASCSSALASIKVIELGLSGVVCNTCTYTFKKTLKRLKFIKSIQLSRTTGKALLNLDNKETFSLKELNSAILESGFSTRYIKVTLGSRVTFLGGSYQLISNNANFRVKTGSNFMPRVKSLHKRSAQVEVTGNINLASDSSIEIDIEGIK